MSSSLAQIKEHLDLDELELVADIIDRISKGTPTIDVLRDILASISKLASGSYSLLCVNRSALEAIFGEDTDDEVSLSADARISCDGDIFDAVRDWEGTKHPIPNTDGTQLILPQRQGGIAVIDAAVHVVDSYSCKKTLEVLSNLARVEVERAFKLAEAERRKKALEETRARLREQNVLLRELSVVDELTGLHNRRYLEQRLAYELDRVARYKRPLSIAVLDVDHFKKFNDEWGHSVGDEVLCHLAKIANACLRRVDLVARYGGEEFVVLMPETGNSGAIDAINRLREEVAKSGLPHNKQTLFITLSAGVATANGEFKGDAQSFFRAADQALYRAKAHGRNRVISAET